MEVCASVGTTPFPQIQGIHTAVSPIIRIRKQEFETI